MKILVRRSSVIRQYLADDAGVPIIYDSPEEARTYLISRGAGGILMATVKLVDADIRCLRCGVSEVSETIENDYCYRCLAEQLHSYEQEEEFCGGI